MAAPFAALASTPMNKNCQIKHIGPGPSNLLKNIF
jgi:hypothetical protein